MASVMPVVEGYVGDEVTTIKGTLQTTKKQLPADVVTALKAVQKTVKATRKKINTYWPPLPADD